MCTEKELQDGLWDLSAFRVKEDWVPRASVLWDPNAL